MSDPKTGNAVEVTSTDKDKIEDQPRFYIRLVNIKTGRVATNDDADTEEEAKSIANKISNGQHYAHVYDRQHEDKKDDEKGKRIYTTAPSSK